MRCKIVRSFLHHILDVVFPPRCLGCESVLVASHEFPLCPDCTARIQWINGPVGSADIPLGLFAQLQACCTFSGPIIDAIHRLKYERRPDLARPLAQLLARCVTSLPRELVIVPVPLARRRARQRGYNQTQLLATRLARIGGWCIANHALLRRHETRPQVGQERAERLANVRGAFQVRHPAAIRDRHVLLLDDVMTTGATLTACAKALRTARAASISALVVAVA